MTEKPPENATMVKFVTKTTKRKEFVDKSYSKWRNKLPDTVNQYDDDSTDTNDEGFTKRNGKKTCPKEKQRQQRVKKKEVMKAKKEKKNMVSTSSSEENDNVSEEETDSDDLLMLTYNEEDVKVKKRKKKVPLNSDSDTVYEIPKSPKQINALKKNKVSLLNEHIQVLIRDAIQGVQFEKKKKGKKAKEEYSSVRTRSSPKPLFNVIKVLSDDQKQAIRDIGFGSVLEISFGTIPARIGYYVVDRLDERTLTIRLENRYLQIDKQVVHDMYGIPLGGVKFKKEKISKGADRLTREWRGRIGMLKGNIRPSHVVEAITRSPEDAGRNFILNFLVLFNTCMAENSIMGTCNLKFLPYINDDVDIKSLDWCQYVIDCLKESKYYWDRDDDESFYTGPLALLILFYVDSTKCNRLQVIRERPALKSWTSQLLSQRETAEISSGGFGRGEPELPFEEEQNMVNIIDEEGSKQPECTDFKLTNVQEYIESINSRFLSLMNGKEKLGGLLAEALSKFPDNEKLQQYNKQAEEFFGKSTFDARKPDRNGIAFKEHYNKQVEELFGQSSFDAKKPDMNENSSLEAFTGQMDIEMVDVGTSGEVEIIDNHSKSGNLFLMTNGDKTVVKAKTSSPGKVNSEYSPMIGMVADTNNVASANDQTLILSPQNIYSSPPYTDSFFKAIDEVVSKARATNVIDFEPPSFSLNLTQEFERSSHEKDSDPKEGVGINPLSSKKPEVEKLEGKDESVKTTRTEIDKVSDIMVKTVTREVSAMTIEKVPPIPPVNFELEKPKRDLRPSEYKKSPFKERAVDLSKGLTTSERKLFDYLHSFSDPIWRVVFECIDGYMLIPDMIQTILPCRWILITIIDIWSHMLNVDEKFKSSNSPSRFFCSTTHLRDEVVEEGKLMTSDVKSFFDKIALNSKIKDGLELLKDVDLVFFPVLASGHYYLMCFNLKRTAFLIIDNVEDEKTIDERYMYAPAIMRSNFGRYLTEVGHGKAKSVLVANPQRAKMKWRTCTNSEDCGVFVMRHMETYMAQPIKEWDCGLTRESNKQQRQLNTLRIKYADKILLSDFNIHKDKVQDEMEKFSTTDPREKEQIMMKSYSKLYPRSI